MEALDLNAMIHDGKFWVAVSFFVFVGVFCKWAMPAVNRMLDARSQGIADQLEQANRLRAEAEALLAESQRKQAQAEKDAATLFAMAEKDAAALRVSAEAELKEAIARRTAQAEANIKRAEQEAVAEIRTKLVNIATETARHVIAAQLKDQKDDPAITRALQSIERNIH